MDRWCMEWRISGPEIYFSGAEMSMENPWFCCLALEAESSEISRPEIPKFRAWGRVVMERGGDCSESFSALS